MKIPEATHWAFALRENGNLEIMSLPDLKVRYKIQNLNLAPNVLSDALNTAAIPTTQGNLLKGIAYSVRPKPLFWFRSDTKTETQIGRYFRLIPYPIRNYILKGKFSYR